MSNHLLNDGLVGGPKANDMQGVEPLGTRASIDPNSRLP